MLICWVRVWGERCKWTRRKATAVEKGLICWVKGKGGAGEVGENGLGWTGQIYEVGRWRGEEGGTGEGEKSAGKKKQKR